LEFDKNSEVYIEHISMICFYQIPKQKNAFSFPVKDILSK